MVITQTQNIPSSLAIQSTKNTHALPVIKAPLAHFTKSSIEPHKDDLLQELHKGDQHRPFAPPQLLQDQGPLVEFSLLHAVEELQKTNHDLLLLSSKEIKLVTHMMQDHLHMQEKVLQSTSHQLATSEIFSWMEKVGSCFCSALYITYGTFLVQASAPVLGTTLIAAGAASLSLFAVQELQGVESLSRFLTESQSELAKQVAAYAPASIQALSLAMGALIPATALAYPALAPSYLQMLTGLDTASHLVREVGGANRAHVMAELSTIEGNILQTNNQKESLLTWVKLFVEGLHKEWEQAKTFIELSLQTSRGIHDS
ncbi:MAG: hypothetical protein FJZ58_03940 [Chlamydiae bacterium]|nr:hypothetical protein [Chlamydiota bacterium]